MRDRDSNLPGFKVFDTVSIITIYIIKYKYNNKKEQIKVRKSGSVGNGRAYEIKGSGSILG